MSIKCKAPNGKIVVVFGASRGLGAMMAITLAQEGYAVGVAAKTTENPASGVKAKYKLEGSIESVVREIESFGGLAYPLAWDAVTSTTQSVSALLSKISGHFKAPQFYPYGVVYNAGAVSWLSVPDTSIKKLDLLWNVNARGSFIVVKESLPWLHASETAQPSSPSKGSLWTPKIIVVSPPIYKRFMRGKIGYAMSKVAMTSMVLSLPIDIARAYPNGASRITPVAIWPGASIQSAATAALEASLTERPYQEGAGKYLRKASIWGDTVVKILEDEGKEAIEGRALIDEDYLRERWAFEDADFVKYRLDERIEPKRAVPKTFPNLTVEEEDEELLDTRDLTNMTKVFGKERKAKL
ncbi:NAD(P)-binding protein [Clavulina sp. PMI_390]|nr:NAD(P)-binding protein [Clavulina sp. PMI_390]